MVCVLAVALAAVTTGAKSVSAIAEWADQAPQHVLQALRARRCAWTGRYRAPGRGCVTRVLAGLNGEALDAVVCAWLADQAFSSPKPKPKRCGVAVDGKSLRGSGGGNVSMRHLISAVDHATGVTLAQTDVDSKTNETTRFQALLTGLDLAGSVVTADALHTVASHADRHHIRRRPIPNPHRQRTPRHGHLPQPRHRRTAPHRMEQHRRRPTPHRTKLDPPPPPTRPHQQTRQNLNTNKPCPTQLHHLHPQHIHPRMKKAQSS